MHQRTLISANKQTRKYQEFPFEASAFYLFFRHFFSITYCYTIRRGLGGVKLKVKKVIGGWGAGGGEGR